MVCQIEQCIVAKSMVVRVDTSLVFLKYTLTRYMDRLCLQKIALEGTSI